MEELNKNNEIELKKLMELQKQVKDDIIKDGTIVEDIIRISVAKLEKSLNNSIYNLISKCFKNLETETLAPLEVIYYFYKEVVKNKPETELNEIIESERFRNVKLKPCVRILREIKNNKATTPVTMELFSLEYKIVIQRIIKDTPSIFKEIINGSPSNSIGLVVQEIYNKITQLDKEIANRKLEEETTLEEKYESTRSSTAGSKQVIRDKIPSLRRSKSEGSFTSRFSPNSSSVSNDSLVAEEYSKDNTAITIRGR